MDNCKEIQKLIDKFDNEELSLAQEERFIEHIQECADCREELEIHYIISYGLDENEDIISHNYSKYLDNLDFGGLVEQRLADSRQYCILTRKWSYYNRVRYLFVTACMIMTALCLLIIKLL